MGLLSVAFICQTFTRQTFLVTRPQTRNLSVLAQKIEHATKAEPPNVYHPKPYSLVASELSHLQRNLLNLLGSAHPGLVDIAEYYFLHPSKQLRSLLVLLISRGTNGLGKNWEQKRREAQRDNATGRSNELNRPLTTPDVLDDWDRGMPDNTTFSSVFSFQHPTSHPEPSIPPISPIGLDLPPCLASPPILLPTQIRLAQIVEMIHVASLLHDGIVNEQTQQNDGFGNKLAILGGDFLLGRASTVLSRLGESEVVELISSVISNQVEGEILNMTEIKAPGLGIPEGPNTMSEAWNMYLRRTYLKTASLMAKSARAAVILGGSRDSEGWKEIAYAYGRNLGIAYQLIEDTLCSNPGLATAPMLYACDEHPELISLIRRKFSKQDDYDTARNYIQKSSGVERTQMLAETYASRAREVLQHLPESDTKIALGVLSDMVVSRTW